MRRLHQAGRADRSAIRILRHLLNAVEDPGELPGREITSMHDRPQVPREDGASGFVHLALGVVGFGVAVWLMGSRRTSRRRRRRGNKRS